MEWAEIGTVVAMGVGVIGALFGTQRYNADRRARIYERLDENKAHIDQKVDKDYARKDICVLQHDQVEKELKEIKSKTDLIPDIAAKLTLLVNGKKASG